MLRESRRIATALAIFSSFHLGAGEDVPTHGHGHGRSRASLVTTDGKMMPLPAGSAEPMVVLPPRAGHATLTRSAVRHAAAEHDDATAPEPVEDDWAVKQLPGHHQHHSVHRSPHVSVVDDVRRPGTSLLSAVASAGLSLVSSSHAESLRHVVDPEAAPQLHHGSLGAAGSNSTAAAFDTALLDKHKGSKLVVEPVSGVVVVFPKDIWNVSAKDGRSFKLNFSETEELAESDEAGFDESAASHPQPCVSPMWGRGDPVCANARLVQAQFADSFDVNGSLGEVWMVPKGETCKVRCKFGGWHLVPAVKEMECKAFILEELEEGKQLECKCCGGWVLELFGLLGMTVVGLPIVGCWLISKRRASEYGRQRFFGNSIKARLESDAPAES